MATYKLIKTADNSLIRLQKDGSDIGLYTEVYNTEVTENGWGGWKGQPHQLAFAMAYDTCGDRQKAIDAHQNIANLFAMAAPLELEIPGILVESLINQE
jgi:hypothetical protein